MKSIMLLTVATLLTGTALAQAPPGGAPTAGAAPSTTQAAPPAQTQSVDVGAIFDKLDTNHDGKLTPDEAAVHPTVAAHFKDADANGDGVITKEEFITAFKPQ
jgi:Ca2+-binding EF-hand superfamily protein